MSINAIITRRFSELDIKANEMRKEGNSFETYYHDSAEWQQWATSAQHLIRSVFSETSPHHQNFAKEYTKCDGEDNDVSILKGIFRAAKEDYEGGYIFSMQSAISGEIYGDFVVLAKNALAENAKDVAAVLACAALEDALKRFAEINGLDVTGRDMTTVVNALKSKGLVSGSQKVFLDALPKIRNFAMHADWEEITPEAVNSVIGFVEQFLLINFSGE